MSGRASQCLRNKYRILQCTYVISVRLVHTQLPTSHCRGLAESCYSSSRSPDHVVAAAVMYGSSRAVHARVARQHALNERTIRSTNTSQVRYNRFKRFQHLFAALKMLKQTERFLQYLRVGSMSRHRQLIGPQSFETHSLVIKLKVNRNTLTHFHTCFVILILTRDARCTRWLLVRLCCCTTCTHMYADSCLTVMRVSVGTETPADVTRSTTAACSDDQL